MLPSDTGADFCGDLEDSVKFQTTHFGEVETREEDIFTATTPIPGFPNSRRFFFIERDKIKPFKWLQSTDDPSLTFVVVEPGHFFHEYAPKFYAADLKEIDIQENEAPYLMTIVVLPEDLTKMTANLRGPLILNIAKRKLKQVFLDTDKYTVRESIVEGIKKKEQALLEQQKQNEASKA